MFKFKTTTKFEKDYKKILKSGNKDINKLKIIMEKLIKSEKLDLKYKDHALSGNYKNRRDCHIEPDWILIYKIEGDTIIFERTANHSQLFK